MERQDWGLSHRLKMSGKNTFDSKVHGNLEKRTKWSNSLIFEMPG